MNSAKSIILGLSLLSLLIGAGCQSTSVRQVLAAETGSVKLRSMQTRVFDSTDRTKTLRTIIATLQDLGFVVDKADEFLGTVSATKLSGYQLRMTITVRPRAETQLLVRANAEFQDKAVEEPLPYQDFFVALEKAMFLTAQQVD